MRREIPFSEGWNADGIFGPEHENFQHNVLHAAYLRKYYADDPIAIRRVVPAFENKVGYSVFDDDEKDTLYRPLKRLNTGHTISLSGVPIPVSEMVQAYLYGIVLHANDKQITKDFWDYPPQVRYLFPAALVLWVEQAAYLVIEVSAAIDFYARKNEWGEEYQLEMTDQIGMVRALMLGYVYNQTETLDSFGSDTVVTNLIQQGAQAVADQNPAVTGYTLMPAKNPPQQNLDYAKRDAIRTGSTLPVPRPPPADSPKLIRLYVPGE